MDFIERLLEQKDNEDKDKSVEERQRQLLSSNKVLQEAIFEAARKVISAQSPEVLVQNFPDELATGDDIRAIVAAIEKNSIKSAAKAETGTDELSSGLRALADKLDSLQKADHQSSIVDAVKAIQFPSALEVTNLDELGDFFFSLEQKIEQLKLDPTIAVESPTVNVEKPDLSSIDSLSEKMAELKEAIKEIPVADQEPIERALSKANSTLEKILKRPMPVGSGGTTGGGGGAASSVTVTDIQDGAGDSVMDAANDAIKVNVVAGGGSGGTSATDDSAFTAGSGSGTPAMGFFSADTVDSGDVGVLAMDASRRMLVSIEADNVGIGGGTQYTEADTDASITGTAILWEDTADTLRAVSAAKPLPVDVTDSTIAVTQSGTWNVTDVSGTVSLPTGASTAANQSTIIGHVDGIEGLLTTIDGVLDSILSGQLADGHNVTIDNAAGVSAVNIQDGGNSITVDGTITETNSAAILADTANIDTNVGTIAGAVSGTEMQVDIVSSAAVPVTDNGGSLTVDGTVTANLSATDNAVLDNIDTNTSIPSAMVAFVTDIPTAGVRVQLAANSISGCVIQAPPTNTGYVYIGGSDVSSTVYGAVLEPGQSTGFGGNNTNLIYADVETSGDDVAVIGA